MFKKNLYECITSYFYALFLFFFFFKLFDEFDINKCLMPLSFNLTYNKKHFIYKSLIVLSFKSFFVYIKYIAIISFVKIMVYLLKNTQLQLIIFSFTINTFRRRSLVYDKFD